jgi:hypothetical protein
MAQVAIPHHPQKRVAWYAISAVFGLISPPLIAVLWYLLAAIGLRNLLDILTSPYTSLTQGISRSVIYQTGGADLFTLFALWLVPFLNLLPFFLVFFAFPLYRRMAFPADRSKSFIIMSFLCYCIGVSIGAFALLWYFMMAAGAAGVPV